MVAVAHRISSGSDFSRTLKQGVRVSTRDLMVTVSIAPARWPDPSGRRVDVASTGGPRLGLIVSKAIGDAVTRHAVARRIRAGFAAVLTEFPTDAMIVVRPRPSVVDLKSDEIAAQLRGVVGHRRFRDHAAVMAVSA